MSEIQKIAAGASQVGADLLRRLRDHGPQDKWDARSTLWANSWGLVKCDKNGRLFLTGRGRKVAGCL